MASARRNIHCRPGAPWSASPFRTACAGRRLVRSADGGQPRAANARACAFHGGGPWCRPAGTLQHDVPSCGQQVWHRLARALMGPWPTEQSEGSVQLGEEKLLMPSQSRPGQFKGYRARRDALLPAGPAASTSTPVVPPGTWLRGSHPGEPAPARAAGASGARPGSSSWSPA